MLAIKNKKGLSIIELVVVMAITAVLSTAAVVSYRGYRQQTRTVKVRSQLGYMMIQAESFQANSGFFLPNLEKMNIRLEGMLEAGISLICETGSGGKQYGSEAAGAKDGYEWDTASPNPCGGFTDPTPQGSPPISCPVCSQDGTYWGGSSQCWMGYVLYHTYCTLPNPNSNYPCRGSTTETLYKSENRKYSNTQFEDICQEAGGNSSRRTSLQEARAKFFRIKDSYGMCEKTPIEKESDLRHLPEVNNVQIKCAHSKEYAMPLADIEDIYTDVDKQATDSDDPFKEENLISGPNRLVLTAIGCTKKQKNGCSKADRYNVMSISSDTEIYSERIDQEITPP